jgi:hypothetical protein
VHGHCQKLALQIKDIYVGSRAPHNFCTQALSFLVTPLATNHPPKGKPNTNFYITEYNFMHKFWISVVQYVVLVFMCPFKENQA